MGIKQVDRECRPKIRATGVTAVRETQIKRVVHGERPPDYRIHPFAEAVGVFLVVFGAILVTTFFIYERALDAQKSEIRQGLVRTAHVIRTVIDGDLHRTFLQREQDQTPAYQQQLARLRKILDSDDQIAYVYTAIMRGDTIHFILDPTPPPIDPEEEDNSVHLMQVYDDPNPEIVRALTERITVASEEPYFDQWGSFVSGYVPLYDSEENFIGVLGLDLDASDYFERLAPIQRATVRAMVTGFFVAFLTGSMIWFLRNFILVLNRRRLMSHDALKLALQRAEAELARLNQERNPKEGS